MRNPVGRNPEPIRRAAGLVMKILVVFVWAGALALPARAASCWAVSGWSSSAFAGAQAVINSRADCTTVPMDQGWVHVTKNYGTPPLDELWLQIPLADRHVSGWRFAPLLMFSHYDRRGAPVVLTDLIPSVNEPPFEVDSNWLQLLPYPPSQGVPLPGSRVRFRNQQTGRCLFSLDQNGELVRDVPCTNEKEMVYVIDDDGAGDGGVRLRNEETNQCLYVYIPPSNPWGDWEGFLYNWGCWSDPAMTFILNPQLAWLDQAHSYVLSGFVLDHLATGYCPGSSFAAGGEIPASQCYLFADPGRVFSVDIIGYPSVDLGPGILPPPSR